MIAKLLELRDEGTFIPLLCIDMNVGPAPSGEADDARRYLLRRCGYPCDGRPNIAITALSADGRPFCNDPYHWKSRTFGVAHHHILNNWATLKDGDVVDVEFILGERPSPKTSERAVVEI